MAAFSQEIQSIILTWLMFTLPAANCEKDTNALNCMISLITYGSNSNEPNYTDSRKTAVINSCPKNNDYANESVIEKCNNLISKDELPFDSDLLSPVSNKVTNVFYWNKFCAICNNDENETNWKIWPSWTTHTVDEDWYEELKLRIQRSENDDLPKAIVIRGVKLRSTIFNDRELKCSAEGYLPILLLRRILPRLFDHFQNSQITRLASCQYAENTGRICTWMRIFFEGSSEDGLEIDYKMLFGNEFASDKYTIETSYKDALYICENTSQVYGKEIGYGVKIIISITSLIFIVIYLCKNFNKEYFRNTVNKMLYSYMIGLILIGTILLSIYLFYPFVCVAIYLAHFLWFYHFFWTTLIFIQFCLVYHIRCDDCNRNDDGASQLHSIFGLVIPISMPMVYYHGVLVNGGNRNENVQSCPLVPNHTGVLCSLPKDFEAEQNWNFWEDILFLGLIFIVPILFFFVSVLGFINFIGCGSCNRSPVEATKRDHLIVLGKMALIMAMHWVLIKMYTLQRTNDNYFAILDLPLELVFQLSIDFHGIIMCVVFEMGNCVNQFGCKIESGSRPNNNYAGVIQQSYPLNYTAPPPLELRGQHYIINDG